MRIAGLRILPGFPADVGWGVAVCEANPVDQWVGVVEAGVAKGDGQECCWRKATYQ